MIRLVKKILPLLLVCCSTIAFAQKEGKDFTALDESVKKVGAMDTFSMGTISSILTKKLTDKTEKARAIFDWIAFNISFDFKTARNGNGEKNGSTDVLKSRKATAAGYANLFQDMCSSAGIRCLTVEGYVKNNVEDINLSKPEINHVWNVIQLGVSPDAWYIVDPCWGSGYSDPEFKSYTKAFNPDYFFANLTIFNWQHYPDNTAWHFGPKPKGRNDFYDLPLIKSAAYELGVKSFSPNNGNVKVKANKALTFNFHISTEADVSKVTLAFGEGKKITKKDVEFNLNGNNLSFSYKFPEEDNFPVSVIVNGKELAVYNVTIEE
jgi:transglutaminase/protease-like cytokinesis protein 3